MFSPKTQKSSQRGCSQPQGCPSSTVVTFPPLLKTALRLSLSHIKRLFSMSSRSFLLIFPHPFLSPGWDLTISFFHLLAPYPQFPSNRFPSSFTLDQLIPDHLFFVNPLNHMPRFPDRGTQRQGEVRRNAHSPVSSEKCLGLEQLLAKGQREGRMVPLFWEALQQHKWRLFQTFLLYELVLTLLS